MANTGKGKALVTGASTGIGAVYADRLAKRGYDLVVVARNGKQLQELADRLTSSTGRKVEVLQADLTDDVDLRKVEQKLANDPQVTLLVNNAGIAANGKLADHDLKSVDNIIKLNITALTHLAAAAARSFAARGHGTIVNLASVVALAPEMFNATYTASKAYVHQPDRNAQRRARRHRRHRAGRAPWRHAHGNLGAVRHRRLGAAS